MKIALLADIHGNIAALEAVLADLDRRGADRVANLGDCLSGPLWPRETAERLKTQPWIQIAGNHERQLLTFDAATGGASDGYAHARLASDHFEWMRSLPPTARIDADVLLCHGSPHDDLEYLLETVERSRVRAATAREIENRLGATPARVVACAHTHIPRVARTSTGVLVVNPGSVGLPAYDATLPCPHVMETGSPDARYALVEESGGRWTSTLIAVPYDFDPAAALAERNGRAEWAHALSTGYALPISS